MAGPLNVIGPVRRTYTGAALTRYTSPIAVSARVYVRNLSGTGNNGYVLNVKAPTNTYGIGRGFYLSTPAAGYAAIQCILGGSSTNLSRWSTSGNTFRWGTWEHLVWVIKSGFDTDGAQATGWVGGVEKAGALIASAGSLAALDGNIEMFDRAYDSARQFEGQIEDLAVWSLNPNSSQVAEIMSLRTEADWAASSLAASTALVARLMPSGVWRDYATGYGGETADLSPTNTGAGSATFVDFGALRDEVPELRSVAIRFKGSALYTDLGTTPAAATGDLLRQATDLTLIGNNATTAADTTRPEYLAITGRPVGMAFENVTNNRRLALTTGSYFPTDKTSIVLFGRVRGLTRVYRAVFGNTNVEAGFASDGRMRLSGTNYAIDGCSSPSAFAWQMGASATTVRRDGEKITGSALAAASATGGYIAASSAGASYFEGDIYEMLVIHEDISDATWAKLRAYGASRYECADRPITAIVAGTSSARGQAAGQAIDMAWLAQPSLPRVRFINVSVGGEVLTTTDDYVTDIQGIVQREQALGRTPIVITWHGINDIYVSDIAPATVTTNYAAWLSTIAGYGVTKFLVFTLAQRSETAQNADRLTLNATIRSGQLTTVPYRTADIANLPTILASGSSLDATFDSGDGNHGNLAYFQYIVANSFVPAMRSMTGSGRRRKCIALISRDYRGR